MNYRTRPAENIYSLEELFITYLGLNIPIVPQTSSYSNRHTFSQLFFSQEPNQYDNIDDILSFSVFKDSSLEHLKILAESARQPIYYLIHPDESYPTGTKLGVLFSNLANKNYSGNEQPKAIRELLQSIDYDKLRIHLGHLIEKSCNVQEDFITQIQAYISNVLATDSSLTQYCTIFRCTSPADYLATILLYALFDDVNFPVYASETAASRTSMDDSQKHSGKSSSAPIDLNNSHFQRKIRDARRLNILQSLATYILIALYSAQMIAAIFSFIWIRDNSSIFGTGSYRWTLFSILMLCTSIILTALRFIPFTLHQRYAQLSLILEHSILDEKNNTYSITWSRFQNCSESFDTIQRNRRVMILLFCMVSVLYVVLSFVFNSFPLLVALVSTTFAIAMLADNMGYDHVAYKRYDAYFSSGDSTHTPTPGSGIARMCAWDYDQAKGTFRHNTYNRLSNHSEDCIRYIYDQVSDVSRYSWSTMTAFIITLSSLGVIAQIIQLVNPDYGYFRIPASSMLYSISMIIILLNGILNIVILLRSRDHYHRIADFSFHAGNTSSDAAESMQLFRHHLYSGNISDLAIARGIYNYNFSMYEKGICTSDIQPPDDRYHPVYIVCQKIHLITDIFICICVSYFSLAVWHTNSMRNIIFLPILAVLYALWAFLLYPFIRYRQIKSDIRRLQNEQK